MLIILWYLCYIKYRSKFTGQLLNCTTLPDLALSDRLRREEWPAYQYSWRKREPTAIGAQIEVYSEMIYNNKQQKLNV